MNKKRKWIFLSIVLIALFIVGIGIYFYFNSSKSIFTKAIKKATDNLFESNEEGLLSDLDYKTMQVNNSSELTFSDGQESYSFKMNGNFGYDKSSNKLNMDINMTGNNQKLLDLEGLLAENKVYFRIKDMMDKFYYIDTKVDSSKKLDEKDLDYILDLATNSFFDNLKEKDFSKSKQTIELGDKKFSTTKITLKLSQERLYDISIDFLKNLKSDSKAMDILKKVDQEFDDKKVEEAIKNIEEEKKDTSKDNYILYTIYVNKNKDILKQEISVNDVDDSSYKDILLVINTYDNEDKYKNVEFIIMNKDQEVVNMAIKELNKEEKEITITSMVVRAKGTLKNNDKEESLNIDVVDVSNNKLGTINYSLKKLENKKYTYNSNINFDVLGYKFGLVINNSILLDEKLPEISVKDSQNIENMPQSEQQTIMTKLQERLAKIMK